MVLFCPALHLTKAFPPIPALLFVSPVASPPSWFSFYSLIFSIRPVRPSPFLLPLTLIPLAPIPLCPCEPASKVSTFSRVQSSLTGTCCLRVMCQTVCGVFSFQRQVRRRGKAESAARTWNFSNKQMLATKLLLPKEILRDIKNKSIHAVAKKLP